MYRRSGSFPVPLKNITSSVNCGRMSALKDSCLNNSPISSLVYNLSELSTGRNTPKLRRKLSLSSVDTPPNAGSKSEGSSQSAESGCFSESPLEDSPTLERLNIKRYASQHHPDIPLEAFSIRKKTIAFRRISSEPLPAMRLDSPTDFLEADPADLQPVTPKDDDVVDDETMTELDDGAEELASDESNQMFAGNKLYREDCGSQDSGLGSDSERSQRSSVSSFDDTASLSSSSSSNCLDRLPSLDDMWNSLNDPDFKTPRGLPPKRSRGSFDDKQFSEETCSPTKYSPVKPSSIMRPSFSKALFCQIPETVAEASEVSKSENDDGFQELFQLSEVDSEPDARVSALVSATLLHRPAEDRLEELVLPVIPKSSKKALFAVSQEEGTPSSRPARRGLYRSHSLDVRNRPSFKRLEPFSDITDQVQVKRWKGEDTEVTRTNDQSENSCKMVSNRRLQRCHSETEAIKSAVSRMLSEPDLLGDCSKAYCLPTVSGKHQDLKSITPETLSRLMADEFSDVVEEYHIIDCRYPYEFDGGHIHDALNIYTKDDVVDRYLRCPISVKDPNKRIILVFHCEFSSERGPGLFRFLRQKDRDSNKEFYPRLHYPEIYLLEGGYKSFFETFSHLCEPRNYLTMLDKNHTEDLRKFRTKSKSWMEDKTMQRSGMKNLKF